jgi:hypothetical protein
MEPRSPTAADQQQSEELDRIAMHGTQAATGPTERLRLPDEEIRATTWRGWLMTSVLGIAAVTIMILAPAELRLEVLLIGGLFAFFALGAFGATLLTRRRRLVITVDTIAELSVLDRSYCAITDLVGVSVRVSGARYGVVRSLVFWGANDRTIMVIDAEYYSRRDLRRFFSALRQRLPALDLDRELRQWLGIKQ